MLTERDKRRSGSEYLNRQAARCPRYVAVLIGSACVLERPCSLGSVAVHGGSGPQLPRSGYAVRSVVGDKRQLVPLRLHPHFDTGQGL